jgi:hypothetical protein
VRFRNRGNADIAACVHAFDCVVATYYCRKQLPVFDPFVSYLLWKSRGHTVRVPGIRESVTVPLSINDPAFQRLHARVLAYAYAHNLSTDQKHEFSREIAIAVGADFDSLVERRILQLMNPQEVRALDPELVSVQLHTHRHRTPTTLEALHWELTDNVREIASLTGRMDAPKHFCYPSGIFPPLLTEWLDLHGVRSATTCEPGYATRFISRLAIPRYIDTMGVSADMFRARVAGSAAVFQLGSRYQRNDASTTTAPQLVQVATP